MYWFYSILEVELDHLFPQLREPGAVERDRFRGHRWLVPEG